MTYNITKRKAEIKNYINWFFNCCNRLNENNINTFKKLLYARITCITHEVHITPNNYNSLVKHVDRAEARTYLKDYADKLIKEEFANKIIKQEKIEIKPCQKQ